MHDFPRPLLPEGFTMPVVRCAPMPWVEEKPMTPIEALHRFFSDIADGIRKVVQSIVDWFNSPQVRRFFRCLTAAARRAGLIQDGKALPRRKQRSTKRAMLYQRKVALISIDNP